MVLSVETFVFFNDIPRAAVVLNDIQSTLTSFLRCQKTVNAGCVRLPMTGKNLTHIRGLYDLSMEGEKLPLYVPEPLPRHQKKKSRRKSPKPSRVKIIRLEKYPDFAAEVLQNIVEPEEEIPELPKYRKRLLSKCFVAWMNRWFCVNTLALRKMTEPYHYTPPSHEKPRHRAVRINYGEEEDGIVDVTFEEYYQS